MPWVYTLSLSEDRDAKTVQNDWENNIPGNASVVNDHGGVTVSTRINGTVAVIVSQRNNPDFNEMANLRYVESISEHKEIPSRGQSAFEPPIALGHGITLVE